jgi:hypothetical protein
MCKFPINTRYRQRDWSGATVYPLIYSTDTPLRRAKNNLDLKIRISATVEQSGSFWLRYFLHRVEKPLKQLLRTATKPALLVGAVDQGLPLVLDIKGVCTTSIQSWRRRDTDNGELDLRILRKTSERDSLETVEIGIAVEDRLALNRVYPD